MKTVLIPNPVLERRRPQTYVPLGILSLATVLKTDGFDVEIVDINAECKDPSFSETADLIAAAKPDVVGFSTWCNYYLDLIKVADVLHRKLPGVKILFGGVQATHTDRRTVEAFPQIDVVARGECDLTISEIISSIHDPDKLRKVPGVTFMHRGTLITNPGQGPVEDLDSLPLPDYNLLPALDRVERVGVEVGRGCPFKCGYCVSKSLGEGRFRQRGLDNIITTVKSVMETHGKRAFRFEHDMLTLNRKWLLSLCDALERENLGITWECFSRIDTIDEEMMERMAGTGCNFIYFGIETGSPRMQKILKKRLKLDSAPSIIRQVCDHNIRSGSGFILGFPQEQQEDVVQTMRMMLEVSFAGEKHLSDIFTWLLVPFPGSPLFDEYGDRLALDEHLSNFSVSPATLVDFETVKKYPQVFPTLYHYIPEHLDRDFFVRVAYLMINLLCLRYTGFVLLKDERLGYPESLLDRLGELPMPNGNIYHHMANEKSLHAVSQFIVETVAELGFEDHYIRDLSAYDEAVMALELPEDNQGAALTRRFSHDVLAFIKESRSDGYRHLPGEVAVKDHSVLLRKVSQGAIECMVLPAAFAGSGLPLKFGSGSR